MASTKLISSLIVDQLSVVISRRGFAMASHGSVSGTVRGSGVAMMKKGVDESKKSSTPWIPDPVTGYYKPEDQTNQLDAADLRELLLKNKTRRN